MQEPNFFQSKIAVTKAFANKKLPMTRLHQLYRDIYNVKPKMRNGGQTIQDEERLALYRRGENTIVEDTKMDKLINRYLDSENVDLFEENELLIKQRTSSLFHPILNRLQTGQALTVSKQVSCQTTFDQSVKDKSFEIKSPFFFPENKRSITELPTINETKIKPVKWPDCIEELKHNVERLAMKSHKSVGRVPESLPRDGESTSKRSSTNNQIKVYLHRVGIGHNKSAIEEVQRLVRSTKKSDQPESASFHKSVQRSGFARSTDVSSLASTPMLLRVKSVEKGPFPSGTRSLNVSPEPIQPKLTSIGPKSTKSSLTQPVSLIDRPLVLIY